MNQLDPFIFLNHHGRQEYLPGNHGLPFGPHPHRGFETVTFILEGELTHKDTSGASSTIKGGGVQWMTAGSGLVHAEISTDEFKKKGGPLEILQLWINLPARYKMTAPKYFGLQQNEIPVTSWDEGKVTAQIVSGKWKDVQGAIEPLTDIHLALLNFQHGGLIKMDIPKLQNIFLYIIKGELIINKEVIQKHHVVEFNHDGEEVEINANTDAIILLGFATPFHEPFVSKGPFVMNTREEIMEAYDDYNKGKFGNENL
jgi:redox-sensitive bicupin YhaK (pirin superfamily)